MLTSAAATVDAVDPMASGVTAVQSLLIPLLTRITVTWTPTNENTDWVLVSWAGHDERPWVAGCEFVFEVSAIGNISET